MKFCSECKKKNVNAKENSENNEKNLIFVLSFSDILQN